MKAKTKANTRSRKQIPFDDLYPFFQPIIGADQRAIAGYEILGRRKTRDTLSSLGPYFNDPNIAVPEKIRVDSIIRKKALQTITQQKMKENCLYFFNINPLLFTEEFDEEFYLSLLNSERKGINYSQIVIEITEDSFAENERRIKKQLNKYRELGCKIAIDDVGKGFSNLERIASINPNILKIDLLLVQRSTNSSSYRNVLHALSVLSQKLGASLLFEGIETLENVKNAWKNGAQYYQGYFFAKPQPSLVPDISNSKTLNAQLEFMIQKEVERLNQHFSFEEHFNALLSDNISSVNFDDYDKSIQKITRFLPENCYRVYLCDRLGYQKSANHIKNQTKDWAIENEYLNKNWSWRPYFLQNIVSMSMNQKGYLSDSYCDLETNKLTQTFSYPIEQNLYLFIDIKNTHGIKS
ncbi:EAL domain-containing protein [Bacillus sp. FJAT-45350]|uniref:EAL domain-containing protein n=1 Tax=Bacillus sp. FJAT-45350 TaxID=2011014 RepID=UPI000BB70505|nr:EAL domain-containing protein [Bacillus sp. FJAT-45350]